MMTQERQELQARYELFRIAALEDQRSFYRGRVERNNKAGDQVNRIRAMLNLIAGLVSVIAGLMVTSQIGEGCSSAPVIAAIAANDVTQAGDSSAASIPVPDCTAYGWTVGILTIIAVVAPALAGGFGTLADLYQWDRTTTVYKNAIENIDVADAYSPVTSIEDDLEYKAALRAYVEGALVVMRDETAQWGQLIKSPDSIQSFIDQEIAKAEKAARFGQSSSGRIGTNPPANDGGGVG